MTEEVCAQVLDVVNEQKCSESMEQKCTNVIDEVCTTDGTQDCNTVIDQRSGNKQTNKQFVFNDKNICILRCHIVYEKDCKSEQEQKCQTVTETITQQQCQMINEKICNTINEQSCETVRYRHHQSLNQRHMSGFNLIFVFPAPGSATPRNHTFICHSITVRD